MKNKPTNYSPLVNKSSLSTDSYNKEKNNQIHELMNLPDAIIQTDLQFLVLGWNDASERYYGLPRAMGKNIFDIVDIRFPESSLVEMQERLSENGAWEGKIHFKRHDGLEFYFNTAIHYILNELRQPISIIITNNNITRAILAEKQLTETNAICRHVLNISEQGILLVAADGTVAACNTKAKEILGVSEEQLLGQIPVSQKWKIYKPDGRIFPDSELPAIVSLQTGFPQKNVRLRIEKTNGEQIDLTVNSQALIHDNDFAPYTVVVTFSAYTL
jgi:PAS domain S-box-containing protein